MLSGAEHGPRILLLAEELCYNLPRRTHVRRGDAARVRHPLSILMHLRPNATCQAARTGKGRRTQVQPSVLRRFQGGTHR